MLERQQRGPNTHSRLLFSEEAAGRESSIIGTNQEGVSGLRKNGVIFMLEGLFTSRDIIDNIFQAVEAARAKGNKRSFKNLQRDYPLLDYRATTFEGTVEESFGSRDGRFYRISYGEKFDGKVILDQQRQPLGTK